MALGGTLLHGLALAGRSTGREGAAVRPSKLKSKPSHFDIFGTGYKRHILWVLRNSPPFYW